MAGNANSGRKQTGRATKVQLLSFHENLQRALKPGDLDKIYETLIRKSIEGHTPSTILLFNYLHGRPKEHITVNNENEVQAKIIVEYIDYSIEKKGN